MFIFKLRKLVNNLSKQDGYNWGFIDWSTAINSDLNFEINNLVEFQLSAKYKCNKTYVRYFTFVSAFEDQLLDDP